MSKKIIVTGVTGMDGSLMADFLLKNTDDFIVGGVRRLSVKNHQNIKDLEGNPRFRLIDLDITDQANTEQVIKEEKPDYFINFAANSFVGVSWKQPVNHMMSNSMAVMYQLEAIRKYCPDCKYYGAGTSEEFGDIVYSPQDEAHPIRPRSPYGVSKASARYITKVWRESYDLYAIQGILFNHEHPRRSIDFVTRKITTGIARVKKAIENKRGFEPIQLGNLDAKRDWSDAEDFIEAVWLMLHQEVYNPYFKDGDEPMEYVVASGETHTVREFVEKAFYYAGIENACWSNISADPTQEKYIHPKHGVLVEVNPIFFRPAEIDLLHGDSTLIRNQLGWRPKTNFSQLVEKMVLHDLGKQ